jgi:tRNA(Ile)-lysidine synthase
MKTDLRRRFAEHLHELAGPKAGDRVVVACSGGLDSTVLLHLLRFSPDVPALDLTVAHFDHRMRPESAEDAAWVKGLATAWGVSIRVGRAERSLSSEGDARLARYEFLYRERDGLGARWLLTAHHADDQAETVLFRILRGSGPGGLRGIPARGPRGLLRPLLPFARAELEAYAKVCRIGFRSDSTNNEPRYARNVIRHEILPRAEAAVARGARRSLVRLARLSRLDEEAWRSLMPSLLEGVVVESGPDRVVLSRPSLLALHAGVRARVLRSVSETLGLALGATGTRVALQFTSSSASGRRHALAGGLVLSREFDRLVLSRHRAEIDEEGILDIREPGEGQATFTLAGRSWLVEWTRLSGPESAWRQTFDSAKLTFPLHLRGWAPGDRIRLGYGTKKLKKLFAEMQVPADERSRRPVMADGDGAVIWVPGLVRSVDVPEPRAGAVLTVALREAPLA